MKQKTDLIKRIDKLLNSSNALAYKNDTQQNPAVELAANNCAITNLKILHLEDLDSDVALVALQLRKSIPQHEILVVESKADYISALETFLPDVILADHTLPSFNSLEALQILKDTGKTIPFILITATVSEEYAVHVMREGADDYILKDRLQRLPVAIINALQKYKVRAEREIFFNKVIAKDADLEKKNQQLVAYNKIVSHDLRTPITSILLIAGIIQEIKDETERKKLFQSLKNTALNLDQTLNVLVDIAKINEALFDSETLFFEDIFDKTFNLVEIIARQIDAKFVTDFRECPSINYPKAYIDSIFMNLISNSLKYYSPDRSPVICIRSYTQNGQSVLEFSDNGSGIDLQKNENTLFGLNQTFHQNTDKKGLGLFMIKTQIESRGGTIRAESKKEEGLKFIIEFAVQCI